MKLSVVVPIYNESGNLEKLFQELLSVLKSNNFDYEIIAINDGSSDNSAYILKNIAKNNRKIKIIDFNSNSGQTAAISAGIDYSSGDVVIPIDSDLENDPSDILRLVAKINEGYDVVSGWRQGRWRGSFLTRKIPSMSANFLISKITGIKLHDYGCTLKAYKRDAIVGVRLYGEMHRFIPAYASWKGARVAEIPVNYRSRIYGRSNYGISRTFNVILDLVVIRFLDKYMNRPIHFFGGIGFVSLFLGFLAGFGAIILKILDLRDFVETPLPIFSALFIIVGVQMIIMGVMAEILMRTYYESQNKRPYNIKEKINLD